jgi:hypothetical protein
MLRAAHSNAATPTGPANGCERVRNFGIAKSLFEAIPVAGQVIAGVAVVGDFVSAGMEIAECH